MFTVLRYDYFLLLCVPMFNYVSKIRHDLFPLTYIATNDS